MESRTESCLHRLAACLLILALAGCTLPAKREAPQAPVPKPVAAKAQPISIATWNLHVFGPTKGGRPEVVSTMARVISQFDMIAVQEIKDKSGEAIVMLMKQINAEVPLFDYVLSPRVGIGGGTEQYAFIYRRDKIALIDRGAVYDGSNARTFARPPLISYFKVIGGNFDFVLINSHTKPDQASLEIRALSTVVDFARQKYPNERDFIVLGDLNADCDYFSASETNVPLKSSDYEWIVKDGTDTNVADSNCTYDRIIVTKEAVEDCAGEINKFQLVGAANPTSINAKDISDHHPVSAKFYPDRDTD